MVEEQQVEGGELVARTLRQAGVEEASAGSGGTCRSATNPGGVR
jgi:hypothetical protein